MTIDNIQAGFQNLSQGSTPKVLNVSRQGDLAIQQGGADYQEAALRGTLFNASNTAAQAVSVALATTYTGLCLSNPPNSKFNLVLLGCNYALSVAPAAISSLHLIAGYSTTEVTHTTPGTIKSNIIGGIADSVAKVDTAATISTPTYLISLGSGFTAAALYGTTPSWIDLKGQFIIPPGGFVAIGALTAVTGFGSFTWAEIPI